MEDIIKRDFCLGVAPIRGQVFLPRENRASPGLILCHGIPAGLPDPNDPGYPALAQRLSEEGFATFIFNFRGTGESGGNFDLNGWVEDLKAVVDYALSLKEVNPAHLTLMGFSAGAAVAVALAGQDNRVKAVVGLACPARFREEGGQAMAEQARNLGLFRDPGYPTHLEKWWQGFLKLSPIRWIDKLSPRPLLLVHGEEDALISVEDARALYQRAGEPKELFLIPGAGHRLRQEERAIAKAVHWLKRRQV